jgi:hypothetical protein
MVALRLLALLLLLFREAVNALDELLGGSGPRGEFWMGA